MDGLRRDAARNRDRILAAARQASVRGETLTMNAVARAADVGVGTVYRHFATVDELEEVVVWERFDQLDHVLGGVGSDRFEQTLTAHIALLVEDPLFEAVTARSHPVLPLTASKRDALVGRLSSLLEEAGAEGSVRPGVDATVVLLLACGVAHSIRSAGLTADSERAQALLEIVLRGFRPSQ